MKLTALKLLLLLFAFGTTIAQEADSTLVKLKSDLEKASGKKQKAKVLIQIGDYQLDRDFNDAESSLLQAEKLINSRDVKNKNEDLASVYARLGVIQRRKGNYSEAISFYLRAKKVYEELEDVSMMADLVHNIGIVYRYQNDNRKAIQNFKEAIKLNEKAKDTFRLGASYNMMGVSYRRLDQLDSALICYKKAKGFFTELKREQDIRRVNNNLSTLYAVQKKYDKSIPIKLENLAYYKGVGNKMSTSVAYYNLSRDYSRTGDLERSLKYADSSLVIALKEGYKERISKTFLRKSIIYREMSNYKEAYNNYKSFKTYSDSVYNIESIKRIQELELNHEFEKERKELEIKSDRQESEVKLYVFLFILALVVGSLVGYLLWRNYTARVRIVADKLEKSKLKKQLLDEKVKVSESELKLLVADNTMRLQFIKQFSDQLKKDSKSIESEDVKQYTKSLNFKLQQQITTENKLTSLQDKIEEVNIGFNTKLMELYPGLTKTEREVCSLLRVNLSIKEISSIRNATIDAVKATRYRIRKKLQVPSGIELEHFIQSL